MCADLFKPRSVQSTIVASGGHSLDATAPVFDQAQLLKYSTEDPVAEFGNTFLDILNREPKREQTRVVNLQTIVK